MALLARSFVASPPACHEGRRRCLRQLRGDRSDRGRGGRRPAPRLRTGGGRPHRQGQRRGRGGHDPAAARATGAGGPPRGGRGAHPGGRRQHRGAGGPAQHRRPRAGPHRAAAQAGGRHRAAGRPGRARRAGGPGAAGRRPGGARDRAHQEVAALDAQVASIDERLARSRITSPLTGTVLARYVEPGEFVQAGQPLFKLASLDSLTFRAYVEQRAAHPAPPGAAGAGGGGPRRIRSPPCPAGSPGSRRRPSSLRRRSRPARSGPTRCTR